MSVDFNAALDTPAEILPPVPILSLEAVKPQFAAYVAQVDRMLADAQAIEIKDDATMSFAVALGGEASKISKAIDAKRKLVTADASDYVKSVNGFAKLFTDKLDAAVRTVKGKISSYQAKVEIARREAEKRAQEEARKLQDDLNKEAEEKGVEPVQVIPPTIPEEKKIVHTETGASAHFRTVWKAEVVDDAAVPRNFCTPDMRKINDAVKAGVREIAGVRIWEDKQPVLRA